MNESVVYLPQYDCFSTYILITANSLLKLARERGRQLLWTDVIYEFRFRALREDKHLIRKVPSNGRVVVVFLEFLFRR